MKICICDDDCFAVREIRNLLEPFRTEDDGFDISDFSCGEDLIEFYKNGDALILCSSTLRWAVSTALKPPKS